MKRRKTKNKKSCKIIDFFTPQNNTVYSKETEMEKYQDWVRDDIMKIMETIVLVVISVLGTTSELLH